MPGQPQKHTTQLHAHAAVGCAQRGMHKIVGPENWVGAESVRHHIFQRALIGVLINHLQLRLGMSKRQSACSARCQGGGLGNNSGCRVDRWWFPLGH